MHYPTTVNIPYQEIENGALILLLLREVKSWEDLCARYAYADPAQLRVNTTTMTLRDKLFALREAKLVSFRDEETPEGKKPVGDIEDTGLWARIRVAFGGMSLAEVALLSQHSTGMAIAPVFGRPAERKDKIDIFVLMPFNARMRTVYDDHIKKLGEQMGLSVWRADDLFSPRPFMQKVWDGIHAAELIVADCTQKNPNVFYEIGIAHTVGKKVVLITRSEKDIPSDIKHFDFIPYDPAGIDEFVGKLETFLKTHFGK
jgi:hypothetical protein